MSAHSFMKKNGPADYDVDLSGSASQNCGLASTACGCSLATNFLLKFFLPRATGYC